MRITGFKFKRSFLKELEMFYLRAWEGVKRAGHHYDKVRKAILETAKRVSSLTQDYANYVLSNSDPLLINLTRAERAYGDEPPKLGVKKVTKLALDVLGVLPKPGRGVWLYAFSHEYKRAFVIRANPKDPNRFARKVYFKRVLLRAKEGTLSLVPPLNKAYRYKPILTFKVEGDIKSLPSLELEQVMKIRRGLVIPNLLVEVPVPTNDELAPGLGFIAVVRGINFEHVAANKVVLETADGPLLLSTIYTPEEEHEVSILLLLLPSRKHEINGYYLGSLACEDSKENFVHYLPKNLFIDVEGFKAARLVDKLSHDMLKFCEKVVRSGLYEVIKRDPKIRTKREALKIFYQRMGKAEVTIPNPELLVYEELPTWLNAALQYKK